MCHLYKNHNNFINVFITALFSPLSSLPNLPFQSKPLSRGNCRLLFFLQKPTTEPSSNTPFHPA